ncbi:testis-specific Y-encoded protein 1-like, partial [Fukomys damarensis]|uniref:testis-specific Y-encoded protein 1-like n=1 Tax=Fukomys damarensis TaxID=885580 RepID=UPI00053FAA59
GAVQRAAQSEARASPRQPCGSRKEARLREGPALLSSAGVLLLGEGRGAKEPAERQKRGEGKPGGLRQPPEEKQEEKEPAQAGAVTEVRALAVAGPGDLPCALPPVEHLRALQLDRQPVALHASKAFARLRKRQRPRSKVHLERRSLLIKGIPGFWATAVSLWVGVRSAGRRAACCGAAGWPGGGHGAVGARRPWERGRVRKLSEYLVAEEMVSGCHTLGKLLERE